MASHLGTVGGACCRRLLSAQNYPVSQQQVHQQLHTAIEQAMDVPAVRVRKSTQHGCSYADHEYAVKAKRQNIDLIYQQVLDIVYADQRATLSIETPMLPFSQLMMAIYGRAPQP